MLANDDNDTQAVRVNLKKAWRCWAQTSQVLRTESTTPKLAMLLFGSETWNLAQSSLKQLKGVHILAAWCMAGLIQMP